MLIERVARSRDFAATRRVAGLVAGALIALGAGSVAWWLGPLPTISMGSMGVSSRALLRSIGEALAARSRATGRVDTAAKSDLLSDNPSLAPLYAALAEEWE